MSKSVDEFFVKMVELEQKLLKAKEALEAERARSQKLLEALDYSFRIGALNHQLSEAQCRGNLFKISENSREAIESYNKNGENR